MNNDEILCSLNEEEKKLINEIYLYGIKEIESIRSEEIAYSLSKDDTLDYNWDKYENLTSSLISKGILTKNGDRYSIKNEKVLQLIDTGVINIDKIINFLSTERFYAKCDLENMKMKFNDLKNEKVQLEDELKLVKNEINELEDLVNNSRKILDEHKIKLIEFMGIFISIFTIISVNINFIKILEEISNVYTIVLLLGSVNLITVLSLLVMLSYINKKVLNK
ncbi:hypothetical protein [Clostridium tetani]|uniref:hypothetical protein n=1 Tax=Clostridium tetani TaxID=1513 RepID=UPI002952B46B|nr:hypothetical protein [Clostridium tetani]BDR64409.1 hypothetical protein K134307016_13430 [Clostridium tetani]